MSYEMERKTIIQQDGKHGDYKGRRLVLETKKLLVNCKTEFQNENNKILYDLMLIFSNFFSGLIHFQ